ncbi:putative bifunctional diguanylate cyclase/phosphodiesterase [Kineococcus rubinsiae]|uniref:putative bifunctional diguanylate cyclase/phosphodiesterase n=1 Tax=Kineococcus rubinsiae TaxID=2609562 RepID=UPI00142F83DB|nr:bifunctional diguanylate cyclase/phosphodiesterase [Kineococcus rubinsiae]NIZ91151.1 bifunctional diguanylate cyclase/phosphodiesterase [Kineococcus rubinsiae]
MATSGTNAAPTAARSGRLAGAGCALAGAGAVVAYASTSSATLQAALLTAAGATAVVALVVSCVRRRPRPLAPWWLIAVACVLFLGGAVSRPWSLEQAGATRYLADGVTLSGYTALLVALWWLARAHGGLRREVLCDVLITAAAGGLAAVQHLIVPSVLLGQQALALSVLTAVYPFVDVVLVALVLDVLFSAPRHRSHQLLGAAVVALLVGDSWYAWWCTRGLLLAPAVVSTPFLAGYLLMAGAALCVPRGARRPAADGAAAPTGADEAERRRVAVDAWSPRRLAVLGVSLTTVVVLLAVRTGPAGTATRWAGVATVAVVLLLLVVRAVSAVNGQARARAVLAHRASHDPLTGLPNRDELRRLVAERTARPLPPASRHWLLYLDVDGFKRINDSWGHQTGDELLVAVAGRLRHLLGPEATLARLAGDEFVAVVTATRAELEGTAGRLLSGVAEPVRLSTTDAVVTASIGVAELHDGARTALREADAAMYEAKRAGRRRWLLFDETMRTDHGAAIELELDLRRAVDEDGFTLAYQFIVDVDDGRPVGTEALLRWARPGVGAVSPVVFVPVLEETGLVQAVGLWALEEALHQLVAWRGDGLVDDAFRMSVNVSPRQLLDPGFAERVAGLLRECGVEGAGLVLEITESSMLTEADAATANLGALRALGIGLAVDDFGTGYAALSYLRTLPVTRVKIDRSFVCGLGEDGGDSDEALVRAVVAVSRALGLGVTAEGIETPAQRDVVRRLGVRHGQGWLWARAEPAAEVSAALARRRAAPAAPVSGRTATIGA